MNDKKSGMQSVSFEWHTVLRDVLYNLWTVALAFAIGIMGVYVAQRTVYKPTYQSSVTLCVNTKAQNSSVYTSLAQSEEMAEIMATVLVQPTVKNYASEFAQMPFDATISSSVIENTNLVTLTVTAENPETAYWLLMGVMSSYNKVSDEIFSNAVIKFLSMPSMSSSPVNSISNSWRLQIATALALIDLLIIIFLSVIRDTVKDKKTFFKKVDSELLGCVPHENKIRASRDIFKKKKKGLLINESLFTSLKFTESFHQIASRLKHMRMQNADKVFVFTSVMENEGKSTTVSNLAVSLADSGYKVLVLDFDLKKPALFKFFGSSDDCSDVAALLGGKISPEDFFPGRYRKTTVYTAINKKPHSESQKYLARKNVEAVINYYKSSYDFILIDTAPMVFDADVTNVIPAADKCVLIVRTDVDDSASVNDAIRTVENIGGHLAGCILNDVYPEFSFFGQIGQNENEHNKYGKYSSYGRYADFAVENETEANHPSTENDAGKGDEL